MILDVGLVEADEVEHAEGGQAVPEELEIGEAGMTATELPYDDRWVMFTWQDGFDVRAGAA